jgi:hypothetical protein
MTVQLQLGAAQLTLEGQGARIFAGRDPSACKLVHEHPTLSRRHAELWIADGGAFIRDLGSANGTWVNGKHIGHEAVRLAPGMQIYLGHVPLGFALAGHAASGGNVAQPQASMQMPAELVAAIEQHRQAPAPTAPAPSSPLPADMAYRKQGSNDNGVLLLALKQDTQFSGHDIQGYVEFTALDNETVACITVELVEIHRRKSAIGSWEKEHVWDRMLVRQGPWKAQHNDVLPLPFSLRCPHGVSMTNREVTWEIRGQVDINWAVDIDAMIPITMRNPDIERLRDAMGAMDYRVEDIESEPAGQRFEGKFMPPAQMASEWGVNNVKLEIEYLGANLKVRLKLDRKGLHHDPAIDQVFELGRLRAASQPEVNITIKQMLDQLLK